MRRSLLRGLAAGNGAATWAECSGGAVRSRGVYWGNAPKWFAAVEMIRLAADQDWPHKATKEISKYWRNKRERRMNPLTAVVTAD